MDGTDLTEFIRARRHESAQSGAPLKDVRIIDLGSVVAAPFGATTLADYGAEVIKVEPPNVPDAIRYWAMVEERYQPFWLHASRNKLPLTLNLKHPKGQRILTQLVERSDVLLENMRPGTLDRLGFSTARLWELNKGLIIGRVSGYGQTGPSAAKPGFGTLAEAMSGFTFMNAHPGGPPTNSPVPLADMIAGLHLALGVIMALRHSKRGEYGGQEMDLSLYEPLFSLMGPDLVTYALSGTPPTPMGNEAHYTAPRNSYETKDGKWAALSASSQATFERLMDLVGHPELKQTPGFRDNQERIQKASRDVLNRVIGDWIKVRPLCEVLGECEKAGVTIGPIYTMADIVTDPHVIARRSIASVFDPASGREIPLPEVPIRMSGTPGKIRFPGLPMGAANEVVLADLLGYSLQEIADLKSSGAI
ncbi:MAG TPA: CoA transferase [Candidatus Methylomirabilis sp.]|nr:CoA transferase [Candidatus Methylomirabilis sp.]